MRNRTIKCWKCHKIFKWDLDTETTAGGEIVPEGTVGSNSLIIHCKLCASNVKIHVTNLKTYPVHIF